MNALVKQPILSDILPIGTHRGTQTIVEYLGRRATITGKTVAYYTVTCSACEQSRETSQRGFSCSTLKSPDHCPLCPRNGEEPRVSAGKHCRKCYGYPANRPRNHPCKCGERYAPEVIVIDLDDRNPGNLARLFRSGKHVGVEGSAHRSAYQGDR